MDKIYIASLNGKFLCQQDTRSLLNVWKVFSLVSEAYILSNAEFTNAEFNMFECIDHILYQRNAGPYKLYDDENKEE